MQLNKNELLTTCCWYKIRIKFDNKNNNDGQLIEGGMEKNMETQEI